MAFMQPDVYYDDYFECDTTAGTEVVPGDLVNRPASLSIGQIWDREDEGAIDLFTSLETYTEGSIDNVVCKTGYLARMSAPGYMDCTDWTAHKTEEEAIEYLKEMYGDDDE